MSKYHTAAAVAVYRKEVNKMKDKCDICETNTGNTCYDAKTKMGCWAYMCKSCWQEHRAVRGLGVGIGQKYEKANNVWKKVEG